MPLEPPLPRGWESKNVTVGILALIFGGGLAIFWMYHGVRATFDLDPWRIAFYFSAVVACVLFCTAVTVKICEAIRTPRAWRFRSTPEATTLLLSRLHNAIAVAFHCVLCLPSTIFAIGVPTDRLDVPLTDEQRVTFPWTLAFAAVMCVYVIAVSLVNGHYGALHLTPTTLTYTMGWGRSSFDWNDIASVYAQGPACKNKWTQRIVIMHQDGRSWTKVDPRPFSIGDDATFWFLHYYATHPGSRGELADGRAVERVRDGKLYPWPEPRTGLR